MSARWRGAAVAALHAAAELLPVSSSGHLRALGGADADGDVAAHLVPLVVTVVAWRGEARATLRHLDARRVAFHLAAGAPPSAAGLLLAGRRDRLPLAPGLLAGAAGLALAGAAGSGRGATGWTGPRGGAPGGRSRRDAGVADGVWLGLAQAAALWPGVSRLGTTLAVARLRGFAPGDAPVLAREVGIPVTVGALALTAGRGGTVGRRAAGRGRAGTLGGPVAAVAGAVAALPLARRVDRGAPLWPFAAERALLALVVLRQSRR